MGDSIYKGYNTVTQHWVLLPEGLLGALDDLTDVEVPAPNDKDVLSFDSGTNTWINSPGGGIDLTAIHQDIAAEISGITLKGVPVNNDLLVIEDSADANNKKRITVGSLPFSTLALTAVNPVDVTKAAANVGIATTAAKSDHKHDVSTAAPTAVGVSTASAEGSATTLARSDHSHQSNTSPVSVTRSAAVIGTSNEPARADHKHDISTAAPGSTCLGTVSAEGSASTLARSDHIHQSDTIPVDVRKMVANKGTSDEPARADHRHNITTAAPAATGVSTASAEGSLTTLARSDHAHQSNTAPSDVTKAAAAIGSSGEPARADHKHDTSTAAPGALASGDTVAEGSATSLARSDHKHGPPLQEVVPLTNATGVASVAGEIVQIYGSGADGSFIVAPANPHGTPENYIGWAMGVVLDGGVANGASCRVVTSGLVQVYCENGTRGQVLTAHESVDGHGAGIEYSATSPRYAQGLGVLRDSAPGGGGLTWCILQIQHDISILITAPS